MQGSFNFGGDGGIRTHVPLRTTAFRVRLVMTASIRLLVILGYLKPCGCQQSAALRSLRIFCVNFKKIYGKCLN